MNLGRAGAQSDGALRCRNLLKRAPAKCRDHRNLDGKGEIVTKDVVLTAPRHRVPRLDVPTTRGPRTGEPGGDRLPLTG